MDDNDFSDIGRSMGNRDNVGYGTTQDSMPRPLQPVGAKFTPPDGSEYTIRVPSTQSPQPESTSHDKTSKNPAIIGILCGILGIAVGATGIFGIMQLFQEAAPKCADYNCPQCPANANTLSSLTTSFLNLEPQGQNIIYSPLSIRYGLSLLNAGAAGSTKTQIESILGSNELPKYSKPSKTSK